MSTREMFGIWWGRHWRRVVIGILVVGLVVVSLVFIPKINGLKGELTDNQAALTVCQKERGKLESEVANATKDLATCQENLATCQENLATCQENLTACQEDKEELEEELEEARGEDLPTKAQIENFLHANFNACRTTTVDGLREAFPELIIEGLPLTAQGEGGSCYIIVRVAEGGFFLIGEKLLPLIVW